MLATRAQDRRARHQALRDILDRRRLRAVYQPIVELSGRRVVGFEALARGPVGSPLEAPDELFAAARQGGLLRPVEWACRAAAIQGALDAGLGAQFSLFVNVEPSVVGRTMPAELEQLLRVAQHKLRVVLELTERDLTSRPAELLQLVRWARERWWGVALDDVGADPASLALLPFLRPDVVKLDMHLVQHELSAEDERVLEAVSRHCHRTGASVLAEGIETDRHMAVARSLGASLGQGWLFGRPAPLEPPNPTGAAVRLLKPPEDETGSVFDRVARSTGFQRTTNEQLLAMTTQIEDRALADPDRPVFMAGVGDARRFGRRVARYRELAERCSLLGVVGAGIDAFARTGLRIGPVRERDVLAREWVAALVGAQSGRVLVARGPGLHGPADALVDVTVSDDRDVAVDVARALLERVLSTEDTARTAVGNGNG